MTADTLLLSSTASTSLSPVNSAQTSNSSLTKKSPREAHLFILLHGLWGSYKHMESMKATLRHKLRDTQDTLPIIYYSPKENALFKTFDGIEVVGYRTLFEIISFIKFHPEFKFTKLSVCGYSMGGLVARFLIGTIFGDDPMDKELLSVFGEMVPQLFVTFATPHLGVRFYNPLSNKLRWILDPLLTVLGSSLLGKTGREMFLTGSNDTLVQLSSGKYLKGLRKFKWRIVFANVKNDRTVAFYSAFITDHDPFIDTGNQIKYSFEDDIPGNKYTGILPRIVDLYKLDKSSKPPQAKETKTLKKSALTLIWIALAMTLVFPIALCMNLGGTIYSYIAASKYRKMIASGEVNDVLLKEVDISISGNSGSSIDTLSPTFSVTDSFKTYVQDVYGSIFEDEIENAEDADINDYEEDNGSWNSFIEKYSEITSDNDDSWEQNFNRLEFDSKRDMMLKNLSSVKWIRIPVYIKAINAHGGIVARSGLDKTGRTSVANVEFAGQLLNYLLNH
ncbi:putative hydrolase NDAI_0F00660 [Naumovozyma dairenensis CBS 421]|uniref:DUF676 domain-containing protein n=1 Tax=Naumovozyma dairenensis (strain ATCC 10597 / BCRC 20456 / CBS 421 / NBRC 0211 / NRRL Y-12639) TaxID=1071378 RepID=G0WC74_NAUDC|nr:hypothetical protein NDAI_0F00660 [Naumovozyma dairenensis CBS 421]CCD25385.1 hypothetical protein NDAI_0F00660 [Naumovozyma dairenensis CBS 421]